MKSPCCVNKEPSSGRAFRWHLLPLLLAALPAAGLASPGQEPADRPTSDLYAVSIDGVPVWTEKFRTRFELDKLPEWFTRSGYVAEQQELHVADFSAAGPVVVTIALPVSVDRVSVHPLSRGIVPVVDGRRLHFTLPGPAQLYLRINDLPPLCLFANPPEETPPVAAPSVRYFGPGIHHAGLMTLKSNDTVYLAAGALVYGGLRAEPGATHLRILGRGVLDGGAELESMVKLEDCHGVEFSGITIRNGNGWTNTLVNCSGITYAGVKILSFGPGGDGIDPLGSRDVRVDRCFFRCTDDCIAIKSPEPDHVVQDVTVTGCTMVGFAYSDGVTIGFETNGPSVSRVHVRDCDIIQSRGGSRVAGGHAAFSIICDGPADVHDILYENIRVEADVQKLFELQVTDGTKYDDNPPGQIRGVTLRNIAWAAPHPILLKGFDAGHLVRDVTFEQCTVGGKPLTAARPDLFQINAFVRGVTVR